MALTRLVIDGYGQIELNNVAFPRDGRIEAQLPLDSTDFKEVPAENGMLLAVDRVAKVVRFAKEDEWAPIALNYTTEHMYDERTPGLKNFKLNGKDDFYPRVGFPSVGDKWTSNCVCYDTEEFADEDALGEALDAIKTTALYGVPSAIGAVQLTATAPEAGFCLIVTDKTTMPDGTLGIKFQVINA